MAYIPLNMTANTYLPNLPNYKKTVTEYAKWVNQNPSVKTGYKNLGITDESMPKGHWTSSENEADRAWDEGYRIENWSKSGQPLYYVSGIQFNKQEGTSGADQAIMSNKDYNFVNNDLRTQWEKLEAEKSTATPERLAEIEKEQADLHRQAETVRYGYGYLGGEDGSMYIPISHLEPGGLDNLGNIGGSGGYGVNSYEQYIQEMYAAQRAAALAAIDAAYQQNVNAIDRAGEGLAEAYQGARNQTVGAGELSKRNFAQYAAANGLNSGTGGQAELARNVALQNNLNSINTQEAQSVADLELQRANAEVEYNNAIAQAEAEGDYELAAALYQEKVRYDNAVTAAIQQEFENNLALMQFNSNQEQQAWENQFMVNQYNDSQAQSNQSSLADYGAAFLNAGVMPSAEMLQAMNLTEADARRYISSLQSKSEGVPVGDDSNTDPILTYNQVMSAIENGNVTPAVKAAFEYYNGVSYDEFYGAPQPQPQPEVGSTLSDLLGSNPLWNSIKENTSSFPAGQISVPSTNVATIDITLSSMQAAGANMTEIRAALRDALNEGLIDQNDYDYLAGKYLTWGR